MRRRVVYSEFAYVWRHRRELRDAPPLEDCSRLPSLELATTNCCLNWSYQESLKARRWVTRHRWDEITEAIEEAQRLYQFWESVREAQSRDRSWAGRRRALMRLRDDLLGPAAYYRRAFPPSLPIWRFAEVD